MMTSRSNALTARWRRLDTRLADIEAAQHVSDLHGMPDALAGALHELYDLWEVWRAQVGLTLRGQDEFVATDPQGETAAALVFARGAKSHALVEWGELGLARPEPAAEHEAEPAAGYGSVYRPFYGVWIWQEHADLNPRYADRNRWYSIRVAGREVLPPLEAAVAWLRQRPELVP